jgi:hypothetical protein
MSVKATACDGALAGVLLAMLPCLSKLRIETALSMPPLFKMLFGSKLDGRFPLARVASFAKMRVATFLTARPISLGLRKSRC